MSRSFTRHRKTLSFNLSPPLISGKKLKKLVESTQIPSYPSGKPANSTAIDFGHATEVELEHHGRILVPPLLREKLPLELRTISL